MVKDRLVCIFAHPDDEAFGPSGTIAKYAREKDVFIICVTDGSAQKSAYKNLARKRQKEIHRSSQILGVKKLFCLGYKDGELCNKKYHEVSKNIEKILRKIKPSELMTFEMRGVSGHIDHVFCSMVSSYLFQKLSFIKTLFYFCIPRSWSEKMKDYFIYFPPGYDGGEVDKVEDIAEFWDRKVQAIKAHESQISDTKIVLKILENSPKEEYFMILKK